MWVGICAGVGESDVSGTIRHENVCMYCMYVVYSGTPKC